MKTDINPDEYFKFSKAVKLFPFEVSPATIRNWTITGKKGVILRSELGRVCQRDVEDFLDQISEKTEGVPSILVARIRAARLGYRP